MLSTMKYPFMCKNLIIFEVFYNDIKKKEDKGNIPLHSGDYMYIYI